MLMKKDKKNGPVESSTISTLLGKDTLFEGTLTFKETIRVDGRIRGKLISADGTAIIGESAVLDADLEVAVAILRGKINGQVQASQRIEIYAPAEVHGDIIAPVIAIDSGVVFNGKCNMQPAPGKTPRSGEKEKLKVPPTEAPEEKIAKTL
jgi:cytoskeletal protein CcmA (bactofilin family)